jgi:hypothetical protein
MTVLECPLWANFVEKLFREGGARSLAVDVPNRLAGFGT